MLRCLIILLLQLPFLGATAQFTDIQKGKELVFASDTQAPMWVETLWLKQNNNKTATRDIFRDIKDRHPAAVYLLGDVVNLGSSNRQWRPMDVYLDSLRAQGIKVSAALGNHEVMGRSKTGQRKFQQRFPNHVKTGYIDTVDSIAVILLNSNFHKLTAQDDTTQTEWYRKTLQQLDADPSIRFIITACHHSPYTNSKIVGSSMAVRDLFVPPFLQSAKSRLFLSGHSHNFEHFLEGGKDFFVIGGGGGLHQPLKQGANVLPDESADYKPLFHYLTVRRSGDTLQLASVRLKPDFTGFQTGARFAITSTASATPIH